MKETKKATFAKYGIEYENGKIFHPEFGFIPLLLVNGNTKLGKGVFTFSTLPTNKAFTVEINGKTYTEFGTCACHCVGCYATKGNYNFSGVKKSLLVKTWLCRHDLDFVKRAIMAQIESENIEMLRIHAAGDFFSPEYVELWREIVKAFPSCLFWTYTKVDYAEKAFDGFSNANIVKSCIQGIGFNFGHCNYILRVYEILKKAGKKVYICRCGIDKNQHCTNCRGCAENEFVLFIEHSTEYNAENDPYFETLKTVIENQ